MPCALLPEIGGWKGPKASAARRPRTSPPHCCIAIATSWRLLCTRTVCERASLGPLPRGPNERAGIERGEVLHTPHWATAMHTQARAAFHSSLALETVLQGVKLPRSSSECLFSVDRTCSGFIPKNVCEGIHCEHLFLKHYPFYHHVLIPTTGHFMEHAGRRYALRSLPSNCHFSLRAGRNMQPRIRASSMVIHKARIHKIPVIEAFQGFST